MYDIMYRNQENLYNASLLCIDFGCLSYSYSFVGEDLQPVPSDRWACSMVQHTDYKSARAGIAVEE